MSSSPSSSCSPSCLCRHWKIDFSHCPHNDGIEKVILNLKSFANVSIVVQLPTTDEDDAMAWPLFEEGLS
jgi:hypothetical protein